MKIVDKTKEKFRNLLLLLLRKILGRIALSTIQDGVYTPESRVVSLPPPSLPLTWGRFFLMLSTNICLWKDSYKLQHRCHECKDDHLVVFLVLRLKGISLKQSYACLPCISEDPQPKLKHDFIAWLQSYDKKVEPTDLLSSNFYIREESIRRKKQELNYDTTAS